MPASAPRFDPWTTEKRSPRFPMRLNQYTWGRIELGPDSIRHWPLSLWLTMLDKPVYHRYFRAMYCTPRVKEMYCSNPRNKERRGLGRRIRSFPAISDLQGGANNGPSPADPRAEAQSINSPTLCPSTSTLEGYSTSFAIIGPSKVIRLFKRVLPILSSMRTYR